jgi:hypothetical protein
VLARITSSAYLSLRILRGKEGKGVTPAVAVEMEPELLLAGEDPQMQKALEVVREI